MLEEARHRTTEFQRRLKDAGIELAVITDESSIAYLAGFWGYLSVEFGRPTFLVLRPDEEPTVITPLMESEMVSAMTWVRDVRVWEDMGRNGWPSVLAKAIGPTPAHRPASTIVRTVSEAGPVKRHLDGRDDCRGHKAFLGAGKPV